VINSSATKPKIIPKAKAHNSQQLRLRVSLTNRSLVRLQIGYFRINPIHAADKIIAVTNAADATVNFDLISKLNQNIVAQATYTIAS
jgi:Fic family protein